MRKFFELLFAAALVVVGVPASAQSLDDAFAALDGAVQSVSQRQSTDVAQLRSRIDLLRAAAATIPSQDRDDYAASLRAHADVLTQAAAETNPIRAASMIAEVEADLALKVRARRLGAGNVLRGHVEVNVVPRRGQTEVENLTVGANPVALARSANLLYRFPRLSSPTSRPLPPGRYEFVVLQGNRVIARERADIGTDQRSSVTLELSVPAE